MTDEYTDAGSKTADVPDGARPDEDAVKAALREIEEARFREMTIDDQCCDVVLVDLVLAVAAGAFSKAFLETMGKRAGDRVANMPKQIGDLVRTRIHRKGQPHECRIGLKDDVAATVVVTEDLPDEARLALLDLDVTADELRGKLLRWDCNTSAWCPADDS